MGPGVQVLFVPSEHLWRVWSLIKHNCAPPTIVLGLLFCPWMQGIFFLVGSNILLLMVVQQLVEVLLFSQEKMSTCPTLPSSLVAELIESTCNV